MANPLEIFVPNPDYKVDEKELEKNIEKNKAIIARALLKAIFLWIDKNENV